MILRPSLTLATRLLCRHLKMKTKSIILTQGSCPGANVLGIQSGRLYHDSGQDPLERLLTGSTYTIGGPDRYINSLKTAIKSFIDREHPDIGEPGLKIVPSLPSGQDGNTWEQLSLHCIKERLGGVLSGKMM